MSPGNGENVVDGLTSFKKNININGQSKIPWSRGYDSHMEIHTQIHTEDISMVTFVPAQDVHFSTRALI